MRLILDFDLTLTAVDSLHLIVNVAYVNPSSPFQSKLTNRETWSALVDQYLKDYPSPLNAPSLGLHLKNTLYNERASYNRVGESLIFRNITRKELFDYGKSHIPLQSYAKEFLEKFKTSNYDNQIYILSLCWSKDLVDAAMGGLVDRNKIWSNDLEFSKADNSGVELSTGKIIGGIFTGLDKLSIFKNQIKLINNENFLTIGVGDSLNDIP
ncbi:hypothetical protein HK096_009448, partial [Nowakowskiella sp. JEL0078]